jgi:hypothetical protein
MCPLCITTAMLIAGSVTSSGGLAAIAIRKFGVKNAAEHNPVSTPSGLPHAKNGAGSEAGEIGLDAN